MKVSDCQPILEIIYSQYRELQTTRGEQNMQAVGRVTELASSIIESSVAAF